MEQTLRHIVPRHTKEGNAAGEDLHIVIEADKVNREGYGGYCLEITMLFLLDALVREEGMMMDLSLLPGRGG